MADSASSTFINSLNRRLSTAASELNFLDSMSFGTVSFEELLGHCNQIYKNNQEDLMHLQDRLIDFGYVPGTLFFLFLISFVDFKLRFVCMLLQSNHFRIYIFGP